MLSNFPVLTSPQTYSQALWLSHGSVPTQEQAAEMLYSFQVEPQTQSHQAVFHTL